MKINETLISVAMATYNGERFLKKQLDSIYAQDYSNIEVVVCDDCSDDGTVAILKLYQKKYGLKYEVNSENIGPNKNFEKVIKQCQGKYIALADQDDIWMPHKLSFLKQAMDKHDVWFIYSDYEMIDKNDRKLNLQWRRPPFLYRERIQTNYKSFYFGNYVTGCSIMFHRNLINRLGYFPDMFHDWWIAYVATYSRGIFFVPEKLFKQRKHVHSITLGRKKGDVRKRLIQKHGLGRLFERDMLICLEHFKNFENRFSPFFVVKGIDLQSLILYYKERKFFKFLLYCRPNTEVFVDWSFSFYIYCFLSLFFPCTVKLMDNVGIIWVLKKLKSKIFNMNIELIRFPI